MKRSKIPPMTVLRTVDSLKKIVGIADDIEKQDNRCPKRRRLVDEIDELIERLQRKPGLYNFEPRERALYDGVVEVVDSLYEAKFITILQAAAFDKLCAALYRADAAMARGDELWFARFLTGVRTAHHVFEYRVTNSDDNTTSHRLWRLINDAELTLNYPEDTDE